MYSLKPGILKCLISNTHNTKMERVSITWNTKIGNLKNPECQNGESVKHENVFFRGGSSRFSDRCINRKCEVTIVAVGATERRRREHLGGFGGMLPQENFETYNQVQKFLRLCICSPPSLLKQCCCNDTRPHFLLNKISSTL